MYIWALYIISQTRLQYYIKYTIGGGYMFQPLRGHPQAIC
jgi:hypothetical protein